MDYQLSQAQAIFLALRKNLTCNSAKNDLHRKKQVYHKTTNVCGRYSQKLDVKKVEEQLKLTLSDRAINWKPSFNIAPSQLAPVVTSDEPDLIDIYHFGLVPHMIKSRVQNDQCTFRDHNRKAIF